MRKCILISAAILLACLEAGAELKIKQPCSDGMVLQQQTDATIWGHASAGTEITVRTSWNNASYTVRTDKSGTWNTSVATPEASYTRHHIDIIGDGGALTISDVLVGEVWLASGQSNMEMPMRGFFNCPVRDAAKFISAAPSTDRIRMFNTPKNLSYEPLEECVGSWAGACPQTIPEMSATAFFFAHKLNEVLNVPIGIISCAYGGARIESWLPKATLKGWGEDLSQKAMDALVDYHRPYLAYNAMLCPLKGYTIKGFIWYQGCSNVGAHEQFCTRMGELIRQWRKDFGDNGSALPFYMVEIAPYCYKPVTEQSWSSMLRVQQHEICKFVPNTGTVVTNDLVESYEMDNIHPSRKQEVGDRLAYYALNRDYGFSTIACESPQATEIFRREGFGSEICVKLTNCPNGMNRWRGIKGLEICGSEQVWVPVDYAYYEWDGYLRLRSEKVFDPCQVRYGWGDFNPGNLANAEGLPVAPFWLK